MAGLIPVRSKPDLSDLAVDLAEAARELGVGVALFIDEMQHLEKEALAAICQACHEAGQRGLPFFVVGAGLPNLPGALAEAKSYAERLFNYISIDRLQWADAVLAIEAPATDEGVSWDSDAIELVVTASGGYPYFIQQFGQTAWNAASQTPIDAGDARDGIQKGWELLDDGFFRARWERATPAEREYLKTMAADGDGPSSTGEVADRLVRKRTALGPVRASLIDQRPCLLTRAWPDRFHGAGNGRLHRKKRDRDRVGRTMSSKMPKNPTTLGAPRAFNTRHHYLNCPTQLRGQSADEGRVHKWTRP